jgi:hypothetical protein
LLFYDNALKQAKEDVSSPSKKWIFLMQLEQGIWRDLWCWIDEQRERLKKIRQVITTIKQRPESELLTWYKRFNVRKICEGLEQKRAENSISTDKEWGNSQNSVIFLVTDFFSSKDLLQPQRKRANQKSEPRSMSRYYVRYRRFRLRMWAQIPRPVILQIQ